MKKIILIAGWVFLSVVGIGAANGQPLPKQEHAAFGERAVTAEEIKMFELLFHGEKKERKTQWDTCHLATYSSRWARTESNRKIFVECIQRLSEDGTLLTTITRTWDEKLEKHRYDIREEAAVVPYVFMETLTLIVDREDETIYFYIWDYDATSRQLRKITFKSYSVLTGKEKAEERILWQMDEK